MSQRLRLRYARGEAARELAQGEIHRLWEKVLLAANLPLPTSDDGTPRPKFATGPPLPRGATSDWELIDVVLAEPLPPDHFRAKVEARLPQGIQVRDVEQVGEGLASIQAAARWSDYVVTLEDGRTEADARHAVDAFMSRASIPWEHVRETKTRHYDIRAMVDQMRLAPADEQGRARLWMRLRTDSTGTGRPDQVLAAMNLGEPADVHRERIVLGLDSPVRRAWLNMGRFRE